jgi:CHAT domain-containing protein
VERLFEPGLDPATAGRAAADAEKRLGDHLEPAAEAAVAAARLVDRLAAWHALRGAAATAERLCRRSEQVLATRVARIGATWGEEDWAAARALGENRRTLALLAEADGRPGEAERLFREAMPNSGRECACDLALLLVRGRRFAEADGIVQELVESGGGLLMVEDGQRRRWRQWDASPFVAGGHLRALLAMARSDRARALEAMDGSRQALRQWLPQELRLRSTRHQLSMIARDEALGLDTCLTLGLAEAGDPTAASLSAAWLANGKAVAAEAAGDRLRAARRDAADDRPGARETFARLRQVQRQLATGVLLEPPAADSAARRRLAELEAEEGKLIDTLGTAANMNRDERGNWVELDAIRARIPSDAIVCDLARFRVRNVASRLPKDDWAPARYAAWIIPPAGAGDVRIVDLGPAAVIDEAVTAWRRILHSALGPGGSIAKDGEAAAEASLTAAGRDLARLVLDPLLAAAGPRAAEVVVIPDGPLWLVSWAALPLEDGRYAVEAFRIRHLVAARDLVRREADGADVRHLHRPLILAAPDFDLGRGPVNPAADGQNRATGGGRLLPRVAPLPGTEREAELIAPLLARAKSGSADVATEEDATERRFLATTRPEALVLATHGFFLAGSRLVSDSLVAGLLRSAGLPADAAFDTDPMLANPLARCGILLAGANAATPAGDGGDDGILTGLEIAGADLRGTKLVVLSACDTAVGTVTDGEGVAGLRQAFQLAGAETVVATLWPIPDAETVDVMKEFFASLAAGAPPARSLRQAQVATISNRRDLLEAAHPAFWAAFTVTGGGTQ